MIASFIRFADFLSEQAIVRSQRRQGVQLFILGIVGIVLTIIEVRILMNVAESCGTLLRNLLTFWKLELVWDGKHSHNTPEAEVLKCLISFFTALLSSEYASSYLLLNVVQFFSFTAITFFFRIYNEETTV